MSTKKRYENRFWAKVSIPGNRQEFWAWRGSRSSKGYGCFRVDGKTVGAHRVVWALARGEANGKHVLHSCDNPGCVNPDHLFLGTNRDNISDKVRKGRQARGTANGRTKMPPAAVEVALERISRGETMAALARELGVHPATMRQARMGRSFKYINRPEGING